VRIVFLDQHRYTGHKKISLYPRISQTFAILGTLLKSPAIIKIDRFERPEEVKAFLMPGAENLHFFITDLNQEKYTYRSML
jgi:hypothetical protein